MWIYEVNLLAIHNFKTIQGGLWPPWIFQNFMYVPVRITYNATFNHDEWMLLSLGVTFFCFFSHNLGLTFVREIRWRYKVFCQKRNVYLSNIGLQQKKGWFFKKNIAYFVSLPIFALFEETNRWTYLEK